MSDLDELLERTTVKFPLPIRIEELKDGLFTFFVIGGTGVSFEIKYDTTYRGRPNSLSERPIKLTGELQRGFSPAINFDVLLDGKFCRGIKFDVYVPGYDSIKDFETLPTGAQKLKLIDDLRRGVERYFSHHRPK